MEVERGRWKDHYPPQTDGCPLALFFQVLYSVFHLPAYPAYVFG